MGDAVDNIPGLPGVAAKTASKLLKQYGSLEETLAHADEIKGKLGEKIRDNAELGLLSKKLARIILEVPVELNPGTLTRDPHFVRHHRLRPRRPHPGRHVSTSPPL